MDQGRIRPPYPVYRTLAFVLSPLVLLVVLKLGLMATLTPDQNLLLKPYLKASYAGRITNHGKASSPATVAAVAKVRAEVYGGRSGFEVVQFPLGCGIILCTLLIVGGWLVDQDRHIKFRTRPRYIKGTILATAAQFRKSIKTPGVAFWVESKSWFGKVTKVAALRIELLWEGMHMAAMGDTGAGKTLMLLAIADEAERNGETCVILDPHEEFVKRHYRPERGDVILNPMDARCPFWSPAAEIDYSDDSIASAGANAQATSLYPGNQGTEHFFFVRASRTVWSYCMRYYRASVEQMIQAMKFPDPIIDVIAAKGELKELLGADAPGQRHAIMGTLIEPLFALEQLPKREQTNSEWSAREFGKHRKGWIFLTSRIANRDLIAPLQRLWVDSIIQQILSAGEVVGLPRVRMILDEVPTLGFLATMVKALMEGRKSGLMLVLGFQGRSGIQKIYGPEAEGIFSAPYTKVLCRTGDPDAGEWGSKLAGMATVERLIEHSAPDGKRSYTPQRIEERLVMAAELRGLEPRHGFLCHGNYTVPIKIAIPPYRPPIAEGFIPRVGNPPPPAEEMPVLEELLEQARLAEAQREEKIREEQFVPAKAESAGGESVSTTKVRKGRGVANQGSLYAG